MARLILFLLLVLLNVSFIFGNGILYKTFTTSKTGSRNMTYRFQSNQGLTALDKQLILDMHNTFRAYLATGKETRGYNSSPQPTATNMQAISWDDGLADFSQNWADSGTSGHSGMKYNDDRFTDIFKAENLSGDLLFVEMDMYGEVQYWNYNGFECQSGEQCGHYLAVANAYQAYMGCGWKDPRLVCNFVGLVTTAKTDEEERKPLQHEYYKGPPCTMCEQGFDFCMSGGLCATKAQCDSDSKNSCTCLNNAATCAANGGTFDQANCRCKCPAGRYGTNCKKACENTPGQMNCGMSCNLKYVAEAYFCNKVCNGCGKDTSNAYKYWYVDRPPKNRNNIKTRGFWPDPQVTPPTHGSCSNLIDDSACTIVANSNHCLDTEFKGICSKHCNTCSLQQTTTASPPSTTTSGFDLSDLSGFDLSGLDLSGFSPY